MAKTLISGKTKILKHKYTMNLEETVKQREKQLFELGFGRYALGFSSQGFIIHDSEIKTFTDERWKDRITKIKTELQALRSDSYKSKTDKEKMHEFAKSLGQITGPELKDPFLLNVLENALQQIQLVRINIETNISVNRVTNVPAASA